ncbi:MAG: prepilin-type N-terminal cleavage/methylation domain-containing protein [Alphaproteobacteria bacterium]|nr:prepilin-type N-terminal cleavage/methylation domain-containing protein [Alphaproteobacteria bacterium]
MQLGAKRNLSRSGQSAYTLLELSIVITIFGLFIAGAADVLGRKAEAERYRTTYAHMDRIEAALKTFVERNGFLPCPAAADARMEDGGSGDEFGEAVAYNTGNPDACDDAPNDGRGMPPVRSLGLPDEVAFDGWGRKFSYHVATGTGSEDDWNSDNFPGDISVKNLQGYELTGINYSGNYGAAYVLLSHGENGLRAWLRNVSGADAVMFIYVNVATTDAMLGVEIENVDGDTDYLQAPQSQYFDDLVRFKTKADLIAPRLLAPPLHMYSLACQSAQAVLTHETEATMVTFAGNNPDIYNALMTAATALDSVCDVSNVTPLVNDCADNQDWDGALLDCFCETAGQFVRTSFDNLLASQGEIFGGCE